MGARWSRMSWSERNELWTRWRRGESLRDIASGLRRAPSVIYTVVAAEGGIPTRRRRRSRLALSATEREEVSRL
jgi:hypothetical protein